MVREFAMDMYTLLYVKWIPNKNRPYSTWNSAQCYVAAWIGGEFRGKWIHVYVRPSSFAVHLKLSHCLLIGYTPIQKRFFKNVMYMYITICEIDHQSRFDAWGRVFRARALGWPWGMGWGGRWEEGSGWGIHVQPWLIHVNVWQNHHNTVK